MSKTALITGASFGIGYELAKIAANDSYDLVLVARSKDKLIEIKNEIENKYGTKVKIIVKDLTSQNSVQAIYDELYNEGIEISMLINNAGFGDSSEFYKCNLSRQEAMINLNILTLTSLTRLFLDGMVSKNSGKILNIASIAAFQAGPYMAVYYATKSYVLSFTEALAYELKDYNIKVSASCPGPTKTNFATVAGDGAKKLFSNMKNADAKSVALYSYQALNKNKTIAIYGFKNKVFIYIQRLLPRKLVNKIIAKMQKSDK